MEKDLYSGIAAIFKDQSYKIIISKPSSKQNQYTKINLLKKKDYYQAECYTEKQVFHKNLSAKEAAAFCEKQLQEDFMQLNAWSETSEFQLKLSKKKKLSFVQKTTDKANAPKIEADHNRTKNYLLVEGETIPPLIDMGVFTKEGKVVASMHDKYKQINRFLEIVDDSLKTYKYDASKPLKVIDFGCGKSYLTFVMYYFLTAVKGYKVNMIGLDLKEDVIEKCNRAAEKYGYDSLRFMVGDIGAYKDDVPADMIITLHACDTATDYALYHAVSWNARMIFSVPCCQHELNSQFKTDSLKIIGRYGIVKERTLALMTDAIRSNLLECCGYKTNLMEFVDFENTPKNLLIRATKDPRFKKIAVGKKPSVKEKCFAEVKELMETFSLKPTFYRLLDENGYLEQYK